MDQTSVDAKRFQEWWDRLPTKGKHAFVNRQDRELARAEKRKQYQAAQATQTGGFICPKCHAPYPTAEARNACRAAHRQAAELERDRIHHANAVLEGGDAS